MGSTTVFDDHVNSTEYQQFHNSHGVVIPPPTPSEAGELTTYRKMLINDAVVVEKEKSNSHEDTKWFQISIEAQCVNENDGVKKQKCFIRLGGNNQECVVSPICSTNCELDLAATNR